MAPFSRGSRSGGAGGWPCPALSFANARGDEIAVGQTRRCNTGGQTGRTETRRQARRTWRSAGAGTHALRRLGKERPLHRFLIRLLAAVVPPQQRAEVRILGKAVEVLRLGGSGRQPSVIADTGNDGPEIDQARPDRQPVVLLVVDGIAGPDLG